MVLNDERDLRTFAAPSQTAAGLPHGGGKSGIHTPAEFARADTEQVVRAFAYAIRDMHDYVPGPDMGTDETAMAWIRDENGRAVGLPAERPAGAFTLPRSQSA